MLKIGAGSNHFYSLFPGWAAPSLTWLLLQPLAGLLCSLGPFCTLAKVKQVSDHVIPLPKTLKWLFHLAPWTAGSTVAPKSPLGWPPLLPSFSFTSWQSEWPCFSTTVGPVPDAEPLHLLFLCLEHSSLRHLHGPLPNIFQFLITYYCVCALPIWLFKITTSLIIPVPILCFGFLHGNYHHWT